MKNLTTAKIVILLMSMLLFGCTAFGTFSQNQAQDSSEPSSAEEPDATPKPFSLEDLPGIFVYINNGCPEGTSCRSIGVASPDWTTAGVITSHTIGMAMFPVWSPDGRHIAYPFFEMEQGYYNEIRVFNFADFSETTITSEPIYGTIDSLTWAPDNRNLVFALTDDTDDSELFSVNIKKGDVVNLSSSPESLDQNPAWSPAGEVIAFDSDRGGTFDIWTISPSGDELRNLTGSEVDSYRDIKPSWSPDGSQIAFFRLDRASTAIWLMNPDGSDQQMLMEFGDLDYVETPVWSPSGEWIALIAGGNPVNNVWLLKPSTGENILASSEHGHYGYLSWAPDSSAVAYEEDIRTTGIPIVHLHALDGLHHYSWEAHARIFYLLWSPPEKLP